MNLINTFSRMRLIFSVIFYAAFVIGLVTSASLDRVRVGPAEIDGSSDLRAKDGEQIRVANLGRYW